MSYSRRAFRQRRGFKDANHAAIVEGLRKLGHHVIDLAGAGDGVPDICVVQRINASGGVTYAEHTWLELKTAKGKLRTSQVDWQTRAIARGVRVRVARTLDEALVALGGAA